MAPNGHPSSGPRTSERPTQKNSRPDWLRDRGNAEFRAWQLDYPEQTLTFEEWSAKGSEHIAGRSLYYQTLQIWDEMASSDEENAEVNAEARPRGGRAQSSREPKKTLKTNGTGLARSTGSATPSTSAPIDELSLSAKKKRKARKKYLSQALVASEESEDEDAAEPLTEATTPSAPVITVNGRRNNSGQKTPTSGDIILPEDEEDGDMAMKDTTASAIASPLPVRSAPKPSANVQASELPKKTILKLNTRKTPKPYKKKILSEETVVDDDTDEGKAIAAAPSNVTEGAEACIATTTERHTPIEAIATPHQQNGPASPDRVGESAAAAATRRGLRARRPAQQKPYSYDVQAFDEDEDEVLNAAKADIVVQPSPAAQSPRASVPPLGRSYAEAHQLDDETLAILQGEVLPEPDENFRRSKHFKGKGRAWKKEESDEDLEFNPSKKKARAKAKAKALQQQKQPGKKRGRPRKIRLSEDVVRDESDGDSMLTEDASPSPPIWEAAAKKTRRPSRKSTLSEAIVRDDSEEEVNGKMDEPVKNSPLPESTTPPKRRVGRPRKSEQTVEVADKEDVVSYTPKGTPNKSYTPKDEPKSYTPKDEPRSYTPKGEPKQRSPSAGDVESAEMDISDSSAINSDDDPVVASPSGIEAHMASVNADDDDDEELCEYGPGRL